MLTRLVAFSRALRDAGLPVSPVEVIDAAGALRQIDIGERDLVRAALAAGLVKNQPHRLQFDIVFDLFFGHDVVEAEENESEESESEPDTLRAAIEEAVASGDAAALPGLARNAVSAFGKVDRPSRDWYSNYEVTKALGLDGMLARILAREKLEGGPAAQIRKDEVARSIGHLRQEILRDTRKRAVAQKGPDAVASYAVPPTLEDASFLGALTDTDQMRKAVRPLARKLATRLAMKRRRARRGHLDVRRTLHRSLSTGGVPFDVRVKRPPINKPDLVILCDVSSSVARFSRFSLMLTHALSAQFSKVRSFVFVDDIVEVTQHLEIGEPAAFAARLERDVSLFSRDGRTDYGEALRLFEERFPSAATQRSTLMILGDARNNYRGRNVEVLSRLRHQVHRVLWLNPEPMSDWDMGDSVASVYGEQVDRMVEVRNLRQLRAFIEKEL